MVQRERQDDSTRYRLISLLPRLRRFCAVLAGDRQGRDALLRVACKDMLAGGEALQPGQAFDRWAFARVYATWLDSLRKHDAPISQVRGDKELFLSAFGGADGDEDGLLSIAEGLAKLPPQQRCAALLIYGEGFSHEEAAGILDVPSSAVTDRTLRALNGLIDQGEASAPDSHPPHRDDETDNVETLFPGQRRAG